MTYIQLTSNSPQLSAYFQRVARQMPNVLDDAVYQSALMAQQMFRDTTATWNHQPSFEISHEGTGRWSVKTGDTIYHYVDAGTVPHIIRARNAAMLRFRVPSTPKTKPRVIGSFAGSVGNQWVSKKEVHHPGTKPREFRRIISQRAQAPTLARLREALKRAINQEAVGI